MHWKYNTKPDLSKFGFVYCITNTKTGQATLVVSNTLIIRKVKRKLSLIGSLTWVQVLTYLRI